MEGTKELENGFVKRCTLITRRKNGETDTLFCIHPGGRIVPTLDDYTIMPNEMYEKLVAMAGGEDKVRDELFPSDL